ncbi:hypothetical protein FBY41_3880 [Humibacillus xanthopallidus]|uniref:Uncharacterized protein n=1 Tax=Humibacillus xanthopallidus TaxID=412689 RepID=A0A543HJJ6_9MICO|nr:hypothetical protein FBY41_3880 [Humibacillus xanthopallidus]
MVQTYRYLRGAMVGLLLALLVSVVLQWWLGTGGSCWLGSISAYYFTPARTAFVGTLCALGITLLAYEGHSPEENVLLDFSGFMALLVAAVPTLPDARCGPSAFEESTDEIAAGIGVSVPTLVLVAIVALVVIAAIRVRAVRGGQQAPPSSRLVALSLVLVGVVVVELVLVAVLRGPLVAVAHGVAASTMVAGAIAVMVSSAVRVDERHGKSPAEQATATAYRRTYLTLAVVLGVLLALTVVLHLTVAGFGLTILVAEVVILVLFGAYWVVQTVELWGLGDEQHPEAREVAGVRPWAAARRRT